VAFGVAVGVAGGVAYGVAVGVAYGVTGGVAVGMTHGVTGGVAWIAGVIRLPIYFFQFIASLALRVRNASDAENALWRSPAIWDDLLVLPQPRLAKILHELLEHDLTHGLYACGQIAVNPFQRWAAQRSLSEWVSSHFSQVTPAFEDLFLHPVPYRPPGMSRSEQDRMDQPDLVVQLILGELAMRSPIPDTSDRLARAVTNPLRSRRKSPVNALAATYYGLIEEEWDSASLEAFEFFRPYQHGEESYQTFRALDAFLKRASLRALSTVDAETAWLHGLEQPLRPATIELITRLSEVAGFMRAYQTLSSETGKRDALTNASLTTAFVRKAAPNIAGPERVLIGRIAQQWFDIIAAEQQLLAAPREVAHLRNMYLVGRPVQPDSGHPFVGRKDQFELIKRAWADATLKSPVILHGQRRMGKTSILYHLEKNLGPAYVTVYANLQSLAAVDSTGAFVYNLCDEIQRRLAKARLVVATPQLSDFAVEPFIGLRHFLNAVEDQLGHDRWLVLLLDEFEMIEEKIKAGVIHQDLLYQLRDAMLNRPRFAIVLAGLHTLDQMTRDYWSPFFSGARNVKVGYLDPDAATTLITNPWDGFELEYDRDAVQFIADVTGSQPTLLQSVCSALIERANARLEKEGPQYHPRVTLADVEAVLGEVELTSTYFDAVWRELADNERCVLSAVAVAQTQWNVPVSRSEVNTKVCDQLSPAEFDQAWDLLKQRDMIDLTSDSARFHVELVRRWVAKHKAAA
jgi:hypothetical protein